MFFFLKKSYSWQAITKSLNILCLTGKKRCVAPIFEEIYSAHFHAPMKKFYICCAWKGENNMLLSALYFSSKVACLETLCSSLLSKIIQRLFSKHVSESQREHLKYHLVRTQFPNTVSELGVSSIFSSLNHFFSGNVCNISYSKYMTAKKFNYSKSINHRLSVSDSRGNQFRNCLEM